MSRELTFWIVAKNAVDGGIQAAKGAFAKLKESVSGMFSGISGMIFGGAALYKLKEFISVASDIKDMAEATGLSTQKFQAFSVIAEQNGVNVSKLTMQMQRLRNIQSSIGQDDAMQRVFHRLGIGIQEVATAEPDALLQLIAQRIRETGDASAAFDIFGRDAGRLIESLKELGDGWDSVVEKTKNQIFTDDQIARLDEADKRLKALGNRAKVVAADLLVGLPEAVGAWMDKLPTKGGSITEILARGAGGESRYFSEGDVDAATAQGRAAKAKRTGNVKTLAQEEGEKKAKADAEATARQEAEKKKRLDAMTAEQRLKLKAAEDEVAFSKLSTAEKIKQRQAELEIARINGMQLKDEFDKLKAKEKAVKIETDILALTKQAAQETKEAVAAQESALKAEKSAMERKASDMKSNYSAAMDEAERQMQLYMNPEQLAAQKEEDAKRAAAEESLQGDFAGANAKDLALSRLNWRDKGGLRGMMLSKTDSEIQAQKVMGARAQAEGWKENLANIEKNTAALDKKISDLLVMKDGG